MNPNIQTKNTRALSRAQSPTLNAKTQFIIVDDMKFAYRRLGKSSGIPLVMLMHFRGTMDFWDMNLTDRLAAARPIVMLDNSGVGESSGEVPLTIKAWACNAISVIRALDIRQVDIFGFSMGGFVAQMFALEAPHLVRKLILAGTMASGGPKSVGGVRSASKELASAESNDELKAAFANTLFPATDAGRVAAEQYWARLHERNPVIQALSQKKTKAHLQAFKHWSETHAENSWGRLHELKIPVFVANGDEDVLIPTINSWHLMEGIKDAHLHIYAQAGHGFLFQFAALFAAHINIFLDGDEKLPTTSKL